MGIGFVVAVVVGVGIAVQVAVLGRTSGSVSPLAVSLALQVSGVAVAAVWATSGRAWSEVAVVARNWWWIPLGAGGWAVVAALGFAANRVGVAATLSLSVAAQVVAGLVIDGTAGSNNLGTTTILGSILILTGTTLIVATG